MIRKTNYAKKNWQLSPERRKFLFFLVFAKVLLINAGSSLSPLLSHFLRFAAPLVAHLLSFDLTHYPSNIISFVRSPFACDRESRSRTTLSNVHSAPHLGTTSSQEPLQGAATVLDSLRQIVLLIQLLYLGHLENLLAIVTYLLHLHLTCQPISPSPKVLHNGTADQSSNSLRGENHWHDFPGTYYSLLVGVTSRF